MKNNKNENPSQLDQEISKKSAEIKEKLNLLQRYEKNFGRDRWFNRYCQDLNELKKQLFELKNKVS